MNEFERVLAEQGIDISEPPVIEDEEHDLCNCCGKYIMHDVKGSSYASSKPFYCNNYRYCPICKKRRYGFFVGRIKVALAETPDLNCRLIEDREIVSRTREGQSVTSVILAEEETVLISRAVGKENYWRIPQLRTDASTAFLLLFRGLDTGYYDLRRVDKFEDGTLSWHEGSESYGVRVNSVIRQTFDVSELMSGNLGKKKKEEEEEDEDTYRIRTILWYVDIEPDEWDEIVKGVLNAIAPADYSSRDSLQEWIDVRDELIGVEIAERQLDLIGKKETTTKMSIPESDGEFEQMPMAYNT